MEIKQIQEVVDNWIKKYTGGYWKPNNMMLRLIEEVGELAREVNHKYGEKPPKPEEKNKDIGDEAADVLFTLICLVNSLDIDLEESFKKVIKKYEERDVNRHH